MRIAVSGTHAIGKSTLAESLGERLPDHIVVAEPYELLEDRGYMFEYPPSVEDYVAQLRESLDILRLPSPNLIVDRCPLDFLGYIHASAGAERFDLEPWKGSILAALASFDLVVALRIDPDHDHGASVEDMEFRSEVDRWQREIVDNDCFDLCEGVDILVLGGPWHRRVETVLAHVDAKRGKQPGVGRS